jgi:hypothetical protein
MPTKQRKRPSRASELVDPPITEAEDNTGNTPKLGQVWMGRPSKYRAEFCDLLLKHMSMGRSFEAFAPVVGVDRATLYRWEKVQGDFCDAKKRGVDASLAYWEQMLNAGTSGQLRTIASEITTVDPKTGEAKTVKVYKAAQFHAVGAIFSMKNRFPDLYKDRQEHRLIDAGKEDLSDRTPEEILAEAERLTERMRGSVRRKK